MSSPQRATELLVKRQYEPAMDALLAAWRTHRVAPLERAIASLSSYLARGVEPIDGDANDWQEQWQRRAKAKRTADLGVLLPLVIRPPKGGIPRRLRGLLEFGADPRIGALLVEMIETPPLTASSNFSMWTELFAALPLHADARVQKRLEARMAERGGKSQFWTKLEKWITAVIPKLPKQVRMPAAWKDELAELDRQLAALAKLPAPKLEATTLAEHSWAEVDDLARARAALDAGELERALDLLVGYWGGCRSPMVAALIERLGLIVDEGQAPPSGRTKKAMHAAWMEAGQHPSPHAVGSLLASMRDGKLGDVELRIEALTQWRPDPRVAQALMKLVKDYMVGARDGLWRAVYAALVHHADPRIAADVQHRHDRLADAHVLHRHISEGRAIRRVYDEFAAAVEHDHDPTADQLEHAEAIERTLAERVAAAQQPDDGIERSLVEAIVAAWDDDGPRLVYSDWLQARQDPRGEFIALDIALAQGKKVKGARKKYLEANKTALFGPLAPIMSWGEAFERGLLTQVQLSTKKGGLDVPEDHRREILEDLRWAVVRSLDVSYDDRGVIPVFEHAPLLALEQLGNPGLAALQGFARRTDTIPLRMLEISGHPDDDDDDWAQLGELARVFPQVESIEIMIWGREGGRMTPPIACFRGALIRRASELRNGDTHIGGVARIDEWIQRMIVAKCTVPRLVIVGPELSAEVRQHEPGRFEIDLTLDRLRWPDHRETTAVVAALQGLPREHVDRLRLQVGMLADSIRPDVEAALAGLPVERVASNPESAS